MHDINNNELTTGWVWSMLNERLIGLVEMKMKMNLMKIGDAFH